MSYYNRIPEDPNENLIQLKSILSHNKRKLEHKKKVQESIGDKIERLREAMKEDADVADGSSESREATRRQTIERKYIYDLGVLRNEIKQLKGKIVWAERRQIPFIESEVARVSAGEAEEALQETDTD